MDLCPILLYPIGDLLAGQDEIKAVVACIVKIPDIEDDRASVWSAVCYLQPFVDGLSGISNLTTTPLLPRVLITPRTNLGAGESGAGSQYS